MIAHQHCATCGTTFRPPVVLTNDTPKCNQCVAASLRTRGVSSATTDKKRKEMRKFQEANVRTASIIDRIIPGAGRTYFGESFGGVFFSFTTAFFIVFGIKVVTEELGGGTVMSQETLMRHAVFLVSVVTYWLIMNTALKKNIE
jgi:hypothetical protein